MWVLATTVHTPTCIMIINTSAISNTYTGIQEKAHAGNAIQNIYPSLTQKTHIRIQPHTLHQSYIYYLKIHVHVHERPT